MACALPTLFLSHGSPMMALEPGAAGEFLRHLGRQIDQHFGRPRAIVVMSPHTSTHVPCVLGGARHDAVHDFGGFPAALYEVKYSAAGSSTLSRHVAGLLDHHAVAARWLDRGGLDHGIWTVLMHMYPMADVPVVPVSLTPQASPSEMLALGQALMSLRREGTLVIGSGSLTHNLSRFFSRPTAIDAPQEHDCEAFRAWVHARASVADWPALLDYRQQAPYATQMHPTDEHWLPFYFAAGAASETASPARPPAYRLHASVTYGHLAMDAYGFGDAARQLM